jgi:hypothetical protein
MGRLPNGSIYARWRAVGEFLVRADGSGIACRQFSEATTESFHVYLLGQALSFAMVKSGIEQFHGTVVAVNGEAVPFLAGSGFGKSSLAASFLAAGCRILTDDLLVLHASGRQVVAFPGPARIKLFPKTAKKFLGDQALSSIRMNLETEKLILPLTTSQSCSTSLPVRTIYVLNGWGPRERLENRTIRIEALGKREAFLDMFTNVFNRRVDDAQRQERQMSQIAELVNLVSIKKLFYPRNWSKLARVRDAVIADVLRRT